MLYELYLSNAAKKKKKVKDTGLLKYLETDPGKSMPAKNLLIGEKKSKPVN